MKAANGGRVSGSANKVDEQSRAEPRLSGKDHRSNGFRLFRGTTGACENIFWNCIVFAPSISMPSRVELHAKPASKIRVEWNGNIVRKIVPFQFRSTDYILYPRLKLTDDEALNEGKNTIDDSRASCRHYYYLSASLIESCFFFIPMECQSSRDDRDVSVMERILFIEIYPALVERFFSFGSS